MTCPVVSSPQPGLPKRFTNKGMKVSIGNEIKASSELKLSCSASSVRATSCFWPSSLLRSLSKGENCEDDDEEEPRPKGKPPGEASAPSICARFMKKLKAPRSPPRCLANPRAIPWGVSASSLGELDAADSAPRDIAFTSLRGAFDLPFGAADSVCRLFAGADEAPLERSVLTRTLFGLSTSAAGRFRADCVHLDRAMHTQGHGITLLATPKGINEDLQAREGGPREWQAT
mmetsp:Transcript_75058/g.151801  ORF Transcript_75058/g.151801 Transcript_75058/m.151801 type:complete len:231 (-) Transcript_75058:2-694(-)